MEPGQVCRLHLADRIGASSSSPLSSSASPLTFSTSPLNNSTNEGVTVTVVIVAVRRHAEDAHRLLYYVHCTHIDLSAELARHRKKAAAAAWHGVALGAIGSGTAHRCSELRVSTNSFLSSEGYRYCIDGWYDASALECITDTHHSPTNGAPPPQQSIVEEESEDGTSSVSSSSAVSSHARKHVISTQRRPVPEEWVTAMERNTAVCEVVYLCYAFQPWFLAPYTALQYLPLPEDDVCHSVYLCHRCLSPFFTREQYFVHVEGRYCLLRGPPGLLLYHDEENGYKAFLIDGAKNLHYGRCLSLLGKHFIESKLLANDVDLYEYVVATTPRGSLPFFEAGVGRGCNSMTAEEFQQAARDFDNEDWDGDVVMGYFSRLKHHPDHTLSCIVALPLFQRMRVATFLLDVAYWMTHQRQSLCGGPQCCGHAGGAISRPFSPHGQLLLLSYWRRALLRVLGDVAAPRRRACRTPQTAPMLTLTELRDMMDIPIHPEDLEMLLLHSELIFYSAASPGARVNRNDEESSTINSNHSTCNGGDGGDAGVSPTSPSSSRKSSKDIHTHGRIPSSSSASLPLPATSRADHRYTATVVLESALLDAAQEPTAKTSQHRCVVFDRRWLLKDSHGVYAYDFSRFHY